MKTIAGLRHELAKDEEKRFIQLQKEADKVKTQETKNRRRSQKSHKPVQTRRERERERKAEQMSLGSNKHYRCNLNPGCISFHVSEVSQKSTHHFI